MNMISVGKFKQVELREIWRHEALDFTNWLALDENLELLSDALGITLFNAQTEMGVGRFSVDILAEDDTGNKIIIENQLEDTDHDHLGKIITYAAGLQAETIVWLVKRAREEHEQAVQWLNENTNDRVNLFLIELEAWKIDTSRPAPRFNIVSKPNEWAKIIQKTGVGNRGISEYNLKQQDFFTKLREYGKAHAKHVKSWQKPLPQHWYNVSIGSSKAKLAVNINKTRGYVGVNFEIWDDQNLYDEIMTKKDEIELELGFNLQWKPKPGRKTSHAEIHKAGSIENPDSQNELIQWLNEKLDSMAAAFPKYLK
ncbi:MAG: DUF4268 domain-containing protein [Candidatus Saccharimonadales bacterium]